MLSPHRFIARAINARALLAAAALAGVAGATPVVAAAEPQMNGDFPLRMDEASVAEKGQLTAFLPVRYLHLDDDTDQVQVLPEVDYGLFKNIELVARVPILAGNADSAGGGDLQLGVKWQILEQSREADAWMPDLSLDAQVLVPTGEDSAGLDTQLQLLVTMPIGPEETQDALHLNLGWVRNSGRASDERENRGIVILGYSRLLSQRTMLLVDLVRELDGEEDAETNLIEIGIIHVLGEHLQLGVGIGAGIGDESPDLVGTVGLQYGF
jgi:hypothetical protein